MLRSTLPRLARALAAIASLTVGHLADAASYYDATYRATFKPEQHLVEVELQLSGEKLPSRVRLHIDPDRYREFHATDPLHIGEREVVWHPQGRKSRLRYQFLIDHKRASGSYDSYMTDHWALFRGEKLVPRASVTARKGLQSHASLELVLPQGWSAATPYSAAAGHRYEFDDSQRRFDQPAGWMLVGKIGVRSERIGAVNAVVAAPTGDSARRQDALAFLNWNLPKLLEIFPDFPRRVLIVSAGDPMWRGGLSGPASLFLHSDRPLISENRTSPMLHELVHVAMGIRGDHESDWIVEGLAEFYSIQTLRRSGGMGDRRYQQAIEGLQKWSQRAPSLFARTSNGATTARAVLVFQTVDAEIRHATDDKASLDDVARKLATERGEVSLAKLQQVAQQVAGKPLRSLQRTELTKSSASPAR